MKKSIKISLISIIVIALSGAVLAYYLFQKPVKDFTTTEADFKLTAKELYLEFVKDQNTAIAKYVSDDKTINVAGTIQEIIKNPDSTSTILLSVDEAEGSISCTLIKSEQDKLNQYKAGEIITIQGQCTGYQELINNEVIMIRCGIK